MSSVYVNEPPTKGKVIITTSLGELEIELWAKETPKACRNFIQLCLEGYYDGCEFFRVIPDFIAQVGDATNTGLNGSSIFGEKFEDEIHSRLKFSRRGIVACAGSNNRIDSQFFITLEKADSLNQKHTIFGRIVGDTMFNLLRVNDLEIKDDKPVYPPKILKTEVIWNPFDDIVPRIMVEKKTPKIEKKGVKNLNLLSFDGEELESIPIAKVPSLHDVGVDVKLSEKPALELKSVAIRVESKSGGDDLKSKIKNILKKKEMSTVDDQQDDVTLQVEKDKVPVKSVQVTKEPESYGRQFLADQKNKYKKGKRKIDENEALKKIQKFQSNLSSINEFKGSLNFKKETLEGDDSYEVYDPSDDPNSKKTKY